MTKMKVRINAELSLGNTLTELRLDELGLFPSFSLYGVLNV